MDQPLPESDDNQGISIRHGCLSDRCLVALAVVTGLAGLVLAQPTLRTLLMYASVAYLCYLAFRIASAGPQINLINLIWVPIHLLWPAAGIGLQRLALPDHWHRIINILMALSLLMVVLLAVVMRQ